MDPRRPDLSDPGDRAVVAGEGAGEVRDQLHDLARVGWIDSLLLDRALESVERAPEKGAELVVVAVGPHVAFASSLRHRGGS